MAGSSSILHSNPFHPKGKIKWPICKKDESHIGLNNMINIRYMLKDNSYEVERRICITAKAK